MVDKNVKSVAVVGPFPPPVHGMAKNLKIVSDDLSALLNVIEINISPGTLVRGFGYHFLKFKRVISGLFRLCFNANKCGALYMPPDAGFGMVYSLLFVFISRFFGLDIYLHHRSFKYINKRNGVMDLICIIGSGRLNHIFLCDSMRDGFFNLYRKANCLVVSNAMYVRDFGCRHDYALINARPFVIGFLSNISFDKGIGDVVQTYRECRQQGINCVLKIGGSFSDSSSENWLRGLMADDANIIFVGFVVDKKSFFLDVDLLLFPTRYPNEAQPNVLFEANAYGVPVVSVDRGCIKSDVNIARGFVVPLDGFSNSAAKIISDLSESKDALDRLKRSAKYSILEEARFAAQQYEKLLGLIRNSCLC